MDGSCALARCAAGAAGADADTLTRALFGRDGDAVHRSLPMGACRACGGTTRTVQDAVVAQGRCSDHGRLRRTLARLGPGQRPDRLGCRWHRCDRPECREHRHDGRRPACADGGPGAHDQARRRSRTPQDASLHAGLPARSRAMEGDLAARRRACSYRCAPRPAASFRRVRAQGREPRTVALRVLQARLWTGSDQSASALTGPSAYRCCPPVTGRCRPFAAPARPTQA